MSKQLLFCIETSQKAKTDKIYIDETIDKYYKLGTEVKKSYIYLNGRSNYNKPKVVREIARAVSGYSYIGKTHVIYCIDTDRYDSDPGQQAELEEITQFCKDNNYELIWFCRDIEDVFWREQIPKADKTKRAAQFRSSRRIENVKEEGLRRNNYKRHGSNILKVLDSIMEKKAFEKRAEL